jgi:Domain of unknown function (DUF4188)
MATVRPGRYSADSTDGFVVFLIGMRVNHVWKVDKWLPTAMAMRAMLKELVQHKEKGLLGFETFRRGLVPLTVMYWRSFSDLENFARNPDDPHLPAWREFNRRVGTGGDVGIFHETYVVGPGQSESIYNNMPLFGLAKATAAVEVRHKGQSARFRIDASGTDDPALPVPGSGG